jgi:hypothetical protein
LVAAALDAGDCTGAAGIVWQIAWEPEISKIADKTKTELVEFICSISFAYYL